MITTNDDNGSTRPNGSNNQRFPARMRRKRVLAVPRMRERGVRYPPPRTPTSNGTNKPKVPLVDFWA